MTPDNGLFLHEELLLLALRDEKGTLEPGIWPQLAIGAASVAELVFQERIAVNSGKRALVDVVDESPLGDAFLDACLARMATARRRASLQTWVTRLAGSRHAKQTVAEGLCAKGVLREDLRKILGIFSQRIFPEADSRPERELRERIARAIQSGSTDLDPRTSVAIALAHRCNILRLVVGKRMVRERRERIEQIAAGQMVGEAVKKAVAATQAALMAATITPAIMASTGTTC